MSDERWPVNDRRIPARMTTYREAMTGAWEAMKEAAAAEGPAWKEMRDCEFRCEDRGLKLARKADPAVAGTRYIARETPVQTEEQIAAAVALTKADNVYQKAAAERKHWRQVWKEYADILDSHPELADQELLFGGQWRALLVKVQKPDPRLPREADDAEPLPF